MVGLFVYDDSLGFFARRRKLLFDYIKLGQGLWLVGPLFFFSLSVDLVSEFCVAWGRDS